MISPYLNIWKFLPSDVYPKELKSGPQEICTTVFTAALFTIGKR